MDEALTLLQGFVAETEAAAGETAGEAAAKAPAVKDNLRVKDAPLVNEATKKVAVKSPGKMPKMPVPRKGTLLLLLAIVFIIFAIKPVSDSQPYSRLTLLWKVLTGGGMLKPPGTSAAPDKTTPSSGTSGIDYNAIWQSNDVRGFMV